MNIKPGWTTSEFWVTITSAVIAVLTLVGNKQLTDSATALLGATPAFLAAVYGLYRTLLKRKALSALPRPSQQVLIPPTTTTNPPVTSTTTTNPPVTSTITTNPPVTSTITSV